MGGQELIKMINSVGPAVKRPVIRKAIETKTGIVVLGPNGKPKKISYKKLIRKPS